MQDFKKLKVWEKAHLLTLRIHQLTKSFPRQELFGLALQLRRSSIAIPSNIAEGCGRSNNGDLSKYLWMAAGSTKQLEYLLLLAKDLGYVNDEDYATHSPAVEEIAKMLTGFIQTVSD